MIIREAGEADCVLLSAADKEIFSDGWSEQMMFEEICNADAYAAIAEYDGALAGYSIVRHTADFCELFRIAVMPEKRRSGVAQSCLMDRAISARIDRFVLATLDGKRKCVRFFRRPQQENFHEK
ncbi:MAG: GNAT family N-acetyltransferase, partial [Spirochaetota bacterium]